MTQSTVSRSASIVFYATVVIVVILGLWASLAEIDQVIRAEATVEPISKVQVVEARYPGTIRTVGAALGQTVKQGDVLFQLDEEASQSDLVANRLVVQATEAEIARLEAEAQGLSELRIANSVATAALRAEQEALFMARLADLQSQTQILTQQGRRLEASIEEALALIESQNRRLVLLTEEYELFEPLVIQGIEPRIRLLDLKQKMNESRDQVQQAELAILGYQIEREETAEKQQQLSRQFRSNASQQLAERRQVLARAEAQTTALLERVRATRLVAPTAGIITAVHVAGPGEVVAAGDTLAEIVPEAESLLIRAQIVPKDISKVSVGQAARVSLSAYDFARYGVIEASVITIAQNTTQHESGGAYYEVWVRTEDTRFSKSPIQPNILPGMQAQVDILGEKRTVLQYLLAPILRASSRALTEQ